VTPYVEYPPRNTRRRAFLDASLKALDVAVGLAVLAGGVFALVATPLSVTREVDLPLFVTLWGILLVSGGFSSALGRLTGIWILETAGIAAAACGALIYLAIVSKLLLDDLGVGLAVCLILVALLALLRRYIELQIFLSEPGDRGLLARLQSLFNIRTVAGLRH